MEIKTKMHYREMKNFFNNAMECIMFLPRNIDLENNFIQKGINFQSI